MASKLSGGIGAKDGVAHRYYHEDGYFDFAAGRWVFTLRDYLGTPRVTFTDVNGDNVIDAANDILDERTLYPPRDNGAGAPLSSLAFGKKRDGYTEGDYRDFTGHELVGEEAGGLQAVHDMEARYYLPGLGVLGQVDPLADRMPSMTPYRYAFKDYLGTPRVWFTDVDGDGVIAAADDILETRTLYPFGMFRLGARSRATRLPGRTSPGTSESGRGRARTTRWWTWRRGSTCRGWGYLGRWIRWRICTQHTLHITMC